MVSFENFSIEEIIFSEIKRFDSLVSFSSSKLFFYTTLRTGEQSSQVYNS